MPDPVSDIYGLHSPYAYLHTLEALDRMLRLMEEVISEEVSYDDASDKGVKIVHDLAKKLGVPEERVIFLLEDIGRHQVPGEDTMMEEGKHHIL